MNPILAGYTLQQVVYEGDNTRVFTGVKQPEQQPVMVKVLKAEYPSLAEITRLRQEFKLLERLNIPGIIRPLALENYQNSLALVLEDFGSIPLPQFLQQTTFSLKQFLNIAIQLASVLAEIHQNQIIHKDLNPSNILIHPQTGQVKIIDFSISSCSSYETLTLNYPSLLEGTLAYMSPEQTGRMNRTIDYRTDFYSLGVTFYQLLTGQLPYQTTDSLELIHCHIAKAPTAPNQLNPTIPQPLSDLVMKLLAKTAEERYQSALGLRADLMQCQHLLEQTGAIAPFEVGQLDGHSQFLIPQQLYGRDQELATLLAALEQASTGTIELMLVRGYSGIGKTALVNQIHQVMTQQRGYFLSSKFEQFKRDMPDEPIMQAFRGVMQQLLTESDAKIALWRSKLLEALGANAQVIIEVLPELEQIIGSQPAITTLNSLKSQNRFNRAFQQFIRVFSQAEHPLVIFLDDLQWADLSSLKLIELLVTNSENQYLLIIGAYRDHEVNLNHPLMHIIERIQQTGARVRQLILQPLEINHVNQLVADILHTDVSKTKSLAELALKKTQGNPFFLTQLLKLLYQDKLLWFDFEQGSWQWDMEVLQRVEITENVVELMVNQIQKLSLKTQNILKLAACVGDKFTLNVLAIVNQASPSETAKDLWEALQAELIISLSNSDPIPFVLEPETIDVKDSTQSFQSNPQRQIAYKFSHDRIQQAAYCLIPEVKREITHLTIGRLLWQNLSPTISKEAIFTLVNQLNYGIQLLTLEKEKLNIAELNLLAAQTAKSAMAYEVVMRYLKIGLGLLPIDSWHQHYDLTLALHQEAAEAAFLSGDFTQMQQLTELVLQQTKSPLDQVKVYQLRIKTCEVQRQLLAAVKLGLQALDILGVRLVDMPSPSDIQHAIAETTANLAGKTIDDLMHLPPIKDANKLAALQLLASLVPAAYQAAPALFILMACQQVNLTIQYGMTAASISGFADYGIVFSGLLQDIATSYQFGQLALNLLEHVNTREIRSQTLFKVSTFILPWKHPIQQALPFLEDAYLSGLENGDLAHAGYAATYKCQYSYWSGLELQGLEQELTRYSQAIAQINQETALKWNQIFHQTVLNLVGQAEDPCQLIGAVYDESKFLPFHIQLNERPVIHYVFLNKLILAYLFGQFSQAIDHAVNAEQYLDGNRGWFTIPIFYFYDSLAHLATYDSTQRSEYILGRVIDNQSKMRNWANHAPANFQHKFDLVEAEKLRVLGNYWQAMELYDRAIIGAREHGYIQEEALANELAATFYLAQGREKVAQLYLVEAYYGYLRWGATAKVQDLARKYSGLSQLLPPKAIDGLATPTTGHLTTKGTTTFDFVTVMKASQALSSEIILGELLTKLMRIVLENAGAEKGYLLLETAGQLLIEASGTMGLEPITVQQAIPLQSQNLNDRPNSAQSGQSCLPISVINYVARTQEALVLSNTHAEAMFAADPYIVAEQPKSLLCTPILHQGKLTGVLYLENNLTTEAFTQDRLEVLQLLAAQAAISIENARLYSDLEEANRTLEAKVVTRTLELQEKNQHLQQEIQERQRAEEAAQIASRAKSEFLANMSHELRTPLNGILGYSQILKKNNLLTEQQKHGLHVIHQCGEYLLTLINDVLDLSKIEVQKMELHPTTVHLPQFLQNVLEICRVRADQKQILLDYQSLSPLPQLIYADEKRLRQVLLNLLGNAVKFTETGSVTFKVGYVKHWSSMTELVSQSNKTHEQTNGDNIRFEITDTGIGIASGQLEQIFQPFHCANELYPRTEGTGLGLAISRQLVQLMGGDIHVSSTLGQGSSFWLDLELPKVSQSTSTTQSTSLRSPIGYRGDRRSVLVVDDKAFNRTVLADLLRPLGFTVIEATDGQEGLEQALEQQPDVVLVDLVMPRMDGFELTRRLRHTPELQNVIVIAISASVFEFDQRMSQEACCNAFLPKPVEESALLEQLQLHLALEWIYDPENQGTPPLANKAISDRPLTAYPLSPSAIPTAQKLDTLLDLALMGDLKGVVDYTQRLEQLEPQWATFATQLRQLAKRFKGKQVIEFIRHHQAQV